jgi:hypothetical protein
MYFIGSSCIFPVPNINKTKEFYQHCLGFKAVEYLNSNQPHICLYRDNIEIILLKANTKKIFPNRTLYGYGYDAYIYTENLEDFEKELFSKDIKIIKSINVTDYQNKEIVIEDIAPGADEKNNDTSRVLAECEQAFTGRGSGYDTFEKNYGTNQRDDDRQQKNNIDLHGTLHVFLVFLIILHGCREIKRFPGNRSPTQIPKDFLRINLLCLQILAS